MARSAFQAFRNGSGAKLHLLFQLFATLGAEAVAGDHHDFCVMGQAVETGAGQDVVTKQIRVLQD